MLRNVLIMAASGIVLFSKEYANAVAQVSTTTSLSRGWRPVADVLMRTVRWRRSRGWSGRS